MGTDAHVLAVGVTAGEIVDAACERLHQLEARWSRFRPDSEISRLNGYAGRPVVVSPDTYALVTHAVDGWHRTAGRFDPTVLTAVRAAGYDTGFAAVRARRSFTPRPPMPAPGAAAIECDPVLHAITMPVGVEVDPGGIGKGLAADLVSAEMVDAGARGALLNLGGDLRVRGEPPNGMTWDIGVIDPRDGDAEVLRVGLHDGAVATTSRVRRQWSTTTGRNHHLIDPRTGRSSFGPYATVTAIAGDAWWAEVVAKAVFVGGLAREQRRDLDAHIATIDDAGNLECDDELRAACA